jgi:predicted lipoprotein with Yx(FWY)xxD motif
MSQSTQPRRSRATIRLGSMVGAIVIMGGLSLSLVALDTAGAASSVVVSTSKTAKYGTILVSGTTLYILKPSKVACGAKCLKIWLPLTLPQGVTSATAGSGVDASKLGTMATSSGALQVTYSGKALYWFYKDKSPGQVKGQITDKWGKWYVDATVKPAHSSSSSSNSGGSSAGTGGASF